MLILLAGTIAGLMTAPALPALRPPIADAPPISDYLSKPPPSCPALDIERLKNVNHLFARQIMDLDSSRGSSRLDAKTIGDRKSDLGEAIDRNSAVIETKEAEQRAMTRAELDACDAYEDAGALRGSMPNPEPIAPTTDPRVVLPATGAEDALPAIGVQVLLPTPQATPDVLRPVPLFVTDAHYDAHDCPADGVYLSGLAREFDDMADAVGGGSNDVSAFMQRLRVIAGCLGKASEWPRIPSPPSMPIQDVYYGDGCPISYLQVAHQTEDIVADMDPIGRHDSAEALHRAGECIRNYLQGSPFPLPAPLHLNLNKLENIGGFR